MTTQWPVVALETLCNISLGKTPPRGDKKFWDSTRSSEIVWMSIADLPLEAMTEVCDSKEYLTPEGAALVPIVPQGTLIMSFKLSVGRTAIAAIDLRTNEAIAAFNSLREDLIDKRFLGYYLGSQDWAADQEGQEKLMGVTLNKAKLRAVQVPLPPLDEQKRIVAKLDQASGITLELENSNRLMQARLQSLSTSLVDHLVSGDGKDASLKEISDVFVDGDWIESKDQSASGIRLLQTGNIGQAHFRSNDERARYISNETFARLKCTEVRPGDVLVSRLPDPVGRACLIPDIGSRMITAVDCTVIRPTSEVLPRFLVLVTLTSRYRAQVQERISGTTRDRISRKNLGEIRVPVPSLSEQEEITRQIDTALEIISRSSSIVQKRIDLSHTVNTRLANELLGGAA